MNVQENFNSSVKNKLQQRNKLSFEWSLAHIS